MLDGALTGSRAETDGEMSVCDGAVGEVEGNAV